LADLVGGFGVAEATLTAASWLRLTGTGGGLVGEPGGPRAVVQGFGSMGGATARYLASAGVPVVGICDAQGLVVNPTGLDVERLLLTRDAYGCVDRAQLRPGDTLLPTDSWLDVDAEILVPAAMSYVINLATVERVRAQLVVEAANVPTVPEAEEKLYARGVTVVPDFVANVATNAWWWWTLFGDIEPVANEAFTKISSTLSSLVRDVLARAAHDSVMPRTAALAMSHERADQVRARHP